MTDYALNPVESYGRFVVPGDYSPENIADKGNEWRDLWAHYVLEQYGIKPVAHGARDIDLTINDEWWEVKSPEASDDDSAGLRFIERSLRKAKRQFTKRGMAGECRVILNTFYREPSSESAICAEISRRAAQHGVKEVLYVPRSGTLKHLIINKGRT